MKKTLVTFSFWVLCNTIALISYGQKLQNMSIGASLQTRYHSNFAELVLKPTSFWTASISIGKATTEQKHFDLGAIEVDGQFWGFGVSASIPTKEKVFPNWKEDSRSAVVIGFRQIYGNMNFRALTSIESSIYDDYDITVQAKDKRFTYFECYVGVEFVLAKKWQIHLMPLMIKNTGMKEKIPETSFNKTPLSGISNWFGSGLGINYLIHLRK